MARTPRADRDERRAAKAVARKAMVAGTSGPAAINAAAAALREGGSAADAVAMAALAQTALAAGCWVSYAGILSFLYYEAERASTHSLNAAYDTVREERNPPTIRATGKDAGRRVLVPGFMAGVQAISDRFGRLPFARLFAPAIQLAEEGFVLGPALHGLATHRRMVLTRLPDAREIFTTSDGQLRQPESLFRQPQLAQTLRRVSVEGSDYMYRGAWARRFANAVASHGGRLDLRDLEGYRARWSQPLVARHGEYDVHVPALPALGGVHAVEAVHLIESADVVGYGHYTESPEALDWLIQITRAARFGPSLGVEQRLRKETAMTLWREIQRAGGLDYASRARMQPAFAHSDAVVAVDERGNVAALCHSINTDAWGSIGLFVDGVSIPDSACFQQHEIAQAGPGERLPDVMNPLIVLRGNRPVLASACVGSALHEVTIQSLLNVLDFQMPVDIAADAPMFYTHAPTTLDRWLGSPGRLERVRGALYQLILSGASIAGRPRAVINPPQAVASNAFPARLLNEVRAMGQTVTEDEMGLSGDWTGISIERDGAEARGAAMQGPLHEALVDGH